MCVGLRPAVATTAEVDSGLTHNRSFNSSSSTVTSERQNMDSECIVNHVLVKSGVVYSKPAKTLFKVRKNMHNSACVYTCMYACVIFNYVCSYRSMHVLAHIAT